MVNFSGALNESELFALVIKVSFWEVWSWGWGVGGVGVFGKRVSQYKGYLKEC